MCLPASFDFGHLSQMSHSCLQHSFGCGGVRSGLGEDLFAMGGGDVQDAAAEQGVYWAVYELPACQLSGHGAWGPAGRVVCKLY